MPEVVGPLRASGRLGDEAYRHRRWAFLCHDEENIVDGEPVWCVAVALMCHDEEDFFDADAWRCHDDEIFIPGTVLLCHDEENRNDAAVLSCAMTMKMSSASTLQGAMTENIASMAPLSGATSKKKASPSMKFSSLSAFPASAADQSAQPRRLIEAWIVFALEGLLRMARRSSSQVTFLRNCW